MSCGSPIPRLSPNLETRVTSTRRLTIRNRCDLGRIADSACDASSRDRVRWIGIPSGELKLVPGFRSSRFIRSHSELFMETVIRWTGPARRCTYVSGHICQSEYLRVTALERSEY